MARTSNCPHRKKKKEQCCKFHFHSLEQSRLVWLGTSSSPWGGSPYPAPLIWKFSRLISIWKAHPLTVSLPTAQSPKRTFCNKQDKEMTITIYHRSKNDYHEKHWASFIPYTEHPLSQIWEHSARWGMVETELRSTDEIHLGRMLMSHSRPTDHMVKYLQGISALRPVSFISGNFRLCCVGLRKFQILYHFTFGDLEFRLSWFPGLHASLYTAQALTWLHGDLLEDREHSWGFWSHIWKNVGKSLLPHFPDIEKS